MRSNDLWDHADIISFEDATTKTHCRICNGICSVDFEGQVSPSDSCTGDCDDYLQPSHNSELFFE